jgi:hypothetical protein
MNIAVMGKNQLEISRFHQARGAHLKSIAMACDLESDFLQMVFNDPA